MICCWMRQGCWKTVTTLKFNDLQVIDSIIISYLRVNIWIMRKDHYIWLYNFNQLQLCFIFSLFSLKVFFSVLGCEKVLACTEDILHYWEEGSWNTQGTLSNDRMASRLYPLLFQCKQRIHSSPNSPLLKDDLAGLSSNCLILYIKQLQCFLSRVVVEAVQVFYQLCRLINRG